MYNLIACVNKEGLLGQENDLYASSSYDLYYFSSITKESLPDKTNTIIMGYNTWLSLPKKPLPLRRNIVITKNHRDELDGIVETAPTIGDALHMSEGSGDTFIIGGASIYSQCLLNHVDELNIMYISEIDDDWKGDENSKFFHYKSVLELMNEVRCRKKRCETRIYNPDTKEYISKVIDVTFHVYQRSDMVNQGEQQYLELLSHVMKNGREYSSRNGRVTSDFGSKMVFELDTFPLLTSKKMGYKTILRELLWFIKGSTDNQELIDKRVHIWDGNSSKEYLESRGLSYEENDLGPIYGFQWRHFGAEYKDRFTDYSGKGVDQLKWLIQEIKQNPSSRRLILSAWNVSDLDKMALPPCHILSQFYVDQELGTLSCQLYQRSGDMFLGVPFNIASYAFLTCILAKLTGYKPGKLHHVIGDTHIYEEHYQAVKTQLKRIPRLFPTLTISDTLTDIDTITEDMFTIKNYTSYSRISAPMKV